MNARETERRLPEEAKGEDGLIFTGVAPYGGDGAIDGKVCPL